MVNDPFKHFQEPEHFRSIRELGERLGKMQRTLYPVNDALKALERTFAPFNDLEKTLARALEPYLFSAKSAERAHASFGQADIATQRMLGSFQEAQKTFQNILAPDGQAFSASSAMLKSLEPLSRDYAKAFESFRVPSGITEGLKQFQDLIGSAGITWARKLSIDVSWQARFALGVAALRDTPWLDPNAPSSSMTGYAHLARLSEAAHSSEPYSPAVGEVVREELGDANDGEGEPRDRDKAAIELGMQRDLASLSPATLQSVVASVGFTFNIISAPLPKAIEGSDPSASYDVGDWQLLREVEQRLRELIENAMSGLAGPDWVSLRVSDTARRRWGRGQQRDRTDGRQVLSAIYYSNLAELADLICQEDNWANAFQPIFKSSEEIRVSLRRLHPIRNALAHNRPIGVADRLTLYSEVSRVLTALGHVPH